MYEAITVTKFNRLIITCEPSAEGAVTIRFAQRIYRVAGSGARDDGPLAEANVRVACVDARSLRPRRLPQFLRDALASGDAAHG